MLVRSSTPIGAERDSCWCETRSELVRSSIFIGARPDACWCEARPRSVRSSICVGARRDQSWCEARSLSDRGAIRVGVKLDLDRCGARFVLVRGPIRVGAKLDLCRCEAGCVLVQGWCVSAVLGNCASQTGPIGSLSSACTPVGAQVRPDATRWDPDGLRSHAAPVMRSDAGRNRRRTLYRAHQRRSEARPLADLSDFQPAELSDFGPALTPDRQHSRQRTSGFALVCLHDGYLLRTSAYPVLHRWTSRLAPPRFGSHEHESRLAPTRVAPRTSPRRTSHHPDPVSHQQDSASHQPASHLAPARVVPRTNPCHPSHQPVSPPRTNPCSAYPVLHGRASRIARA